MSAFGSQRKSDFLRDSFAAHAMIYWIQRSSRKVTKTKGGYPNENILLKLLYAGILKASERWTHPIQDWNLTLLQMAIHFPGRLNDYIDL
jgi:transposase-like protein